MKALLFIAEVTRKFPFLVLGSASMLILVGLMDAAAIITVAPLVDLVLHPDFKDVGPLTLRVTSVISNAGLPVTLGYLLGFFIGFNVLRTILFIAARHLILRAKYRFLQDLMVGMTIDFFRARWDFFSGSSQGILLNTLTRELQVVGDAFGAMALSCASCVQLILFLAVPLYVSWRVTCISVATALVFAIPFFLLGKMSYRFGRRNTVAANDLMSVLTEGLTCAKVIMGFGKGQDQVEAVKRNFDALRRATLESQTLEIAMPLTYFPLGLVAIVIAILSANAMNVPFSETSIIIYSLIKALPIVGQIPSQKTALEGFFPSYEQVQSLRARALELEQGSGTVSFSALVDGISVEDLSFAYPGHEPALRAVSLKIPKGKMTAIVGESGSGKSTLIDMILGFHEPASGHVLIDGVRLQDLDIVSYRRKLGYVPQDSVLFNKSIRDNLLWAKGGATDEEIRNACVRANAHAFIAEFPSGYDTVVGDRGVRLSGGQIQRLALARAILVDPEIFILDEATSSLDTYSERLIQQSIEEVSKTKTVVVVAHRLSTIVNAHHIYLLDGGQLVEDGTYARLCGLGGQFKRMTELQALEISG